MSNPDIENHFISTIDQIYKLRGDLSLLRIQAIARLYELINNDQLDDFLSLYKQVVAIPKTPKIDLVPEKSSPIHESTKPKKKKIKRKSKPKTPTKTASTQTEIETESTHPLLNHHPSVEEIDKTRSRLTFNPTVSSFLHDPFIYQTLTNEKGATTCYTTEEFIHLLLVTRNKKGVQKISKSDLVKHALQVLSKTKQPINGHYHPGLKILFFTEEDIVSILAALPQVHIRDTIVTNEEIDNTRRKVQNKIST